MASPRSTGKPVRFAAAMIAFALLAPSLCLQAQNQKVLHIAGSEHGFLVLRNLAGAILASGELTQAPYGKWMKLRVVFHFRDGSVDDETTIYSQRRTFRLISDHHIQSGPTFPNPLDVTIDARGQQVSVSDLSNNKGQVKIQHMNLPPDLANGILFILLENLEANAPKIEVPYLADPTRMVKLAIIQQGEEPFEIAGRSYKAMKYDIKVELGGLTGVLAPMIGKQPPDLHVWVTESTVPAVIRVDGTLYNEGPVWSIQLASPTW